LLDALEAGEWGSRTTFLSPFDNLICDRARTEQLFGFAYRSEFYTPKARRRYGFYAMPILHGDRLIGRVDAGVDRDRNILVVHALHAEPKAPATKAASKEIARGLRDLARFVGAVHLVLPRRAPAAWRASLA